MLPELRYEVGQWALEVFCIKDDGPEVTLVVCTGFAERRVRIEDAKEPFTFNGDSIWGNDHLIANLSEAHVIAIMATVLTKLEEWRASKVRVATHAVTNPPLRDRSWKLVLPEPWGTLNALHLITSTRAISAIGAALRSA